MIWGLKFIIIHISKFGYEGGSFFEVGFHFVLLGDFII